MLHCGKAVKMNYNKESGANVTPASLAKYFGYDSDLMLDLPRSSFTLAEWTALIDQELQARRPILYRQQLVVISLFVMEAMATDSIISIGVGAVLVTVILT